MNPGTIDKILSLGRFARASQRAKFLRGGVLVGHRAFQRTYEGIASGKNRSVDMPVWMARVLTWVFAGIGIRSHPFEPKKLRRLLIRTAHIKTE